MNIISTLLMALWLTPAALVTHGALAQASRSDAPAVASERSDNPSNGEPAALPDMRLWSFGDCSRDFAAASAQYKECVRVVGSDEAKDARAYHICTVSHQRDRAEAARCKQAYDEKKKLSKDLAARAPLSDELVKRVKSIATVGAEVDKAAQAIADASAAPAPGAETAQSLTGAGAAGTMAEFAPRHAPPAAADVGSASWILFGLIGVIVVAIFFYKLRSSRPKDNSVIRHF